MKEAILYALRKKRVWAGIFGLIIAGGAHISPTTADALAELAAGIFSASTDDARGEGER